MKRAEKAGDEFGTIPEPKADAIAGLYLELFPQDDTQLDGLRVEPFIGMLLVAPEDRGFARVQFRAGGKFRGEVHLE